MKFIDEKGTFELEKADSFSGLYFPLGSETGLKSVVSPDLGGDAKTDQNHFLLEPVSIEGLNNNRNARNFWVLREGKTPWSVTGNSVWQRALGKEHTKVTAGLMWHKIEREAFNKELLASVISFVPVNKNAEVHIVKLTNKASEDCKLRFVAAIPMYGRSADNLRDHRHVTSLLHRVSVGKNGVIVNPTLSFDERGHQLNDTVYYTFGVNEKGEAPASFMPVLSEFMGEGGTLDMPKALLTEAPETVTEGYTVNGVETIGGLFFNEITLKKEESITYVVISGLENSEDKIDETFKALNSLSKAEKELEEVKEYWDRKVNVSYKTGNPEFDGFMHWVSFQPELRRLFGCSFLPHHDYGKGGRGWRDLWQDCLALLLMNPSGVREMLLSNFEGVRTDGTNATIIGSKLGEFKADRNGITRVWMDHAFWPLMTTLLYVNQTGDVNILLEKVPYYKDKQVKRGTATDNLWDGVSLREKDSAGNIYKGTVLEHLLLQNLSEYFEVGEHGNLRLRDADWNDAVDMGGKKGESVAFTHAYAGNLEALAHIITKLSEKEVTVFEELATLINGEKTDVAGKNQLLDTYTESVMHGISGATRSFDIKELAESLNKKARELRETVKANEWVNISEDAGFFDGYYDNDGNVLDGIKGEETHMTLTGQVFAIMCGTAEPGEIEKITKAADKYLFDPECGGYRLNTNFNEIKLNMGRMFGFAYGEKENGAVFSHMAVMYANALYKRGFAHEGYKVLNALFTQAMDFEKSFIYPGIPEYFGRKGRGLYHYLTGAASWYMMTVVNEMFGVRGELGELVTEPKLLRSQFDANHEAKICLTFKGEAKTVIYINEEDLDYGQYRVCEKEIDGNLIKVHLRSASKKES